MVVTCSAAWASRPVVGSSRINTAGFWISPATPIDNLRSSPPDMPAVGAHVSANCGITVEGLDLALQGSPRMCLPLPRASACAAALSPAGQNRVTGASECNVHCGLASSLVPSASNKLSANCSVSRTCAHQLKPTRPAAHVRVTVSSGRYPCPSSCSTYLPSSDGQWERLTLV